MNPRDLITYIDLTCPKCGKMQPVNCRCCKCGCEFPGVYISNESWKLREVDNG